MEKSKKKVNPNAKDFERLCGEDKDIDEMLDFFGCTEKIFKAFVKGHYGDPYQKMYAKFCTDKSKSGGRALGPPTKEISIKSFEQMCAMHCTMGEICSVLDITDKTLTKWVRANYDGKTYSDVYDRFRFTGQRALRGSIWKSAIKKGNPTMQIFLARNELGMDDGRHSAGNQEEEQKEANIYDNLESVDEDNAEQAYYSLISG